MSNVKNATSTHQGIVAYPYLIIEWSQEWDLRGRVQGVTEGLGHYKLPGMPESIRARRGSAGSAL